MPVDPSLKEFCDLLLTATRSGLLSWHPGINDEFVTAKLGQTHYIINATESPINEGPLGKDQDWLITLDVRESARESVFKIHLSGANPSDHDGIRLLREVWEMATSSRRQAAAKQLRTAVEHLRSAIAQSER